MATLLGKFLRKFRIDMGIGMKEMADELCITTAYLSSVELGKKNATENLINNIISIYKLTQTQIDEIKKSAELSVKEISISLSGREQIDKEIVISFARKLDSLSDEEKEKFKIFLEGVNR